MTQDNGKLFIPFSILLEIQIFDCDLTHIKTVNSSVYSLPETTFRTLDLSFFTDHRKNVI